MSSPQEKHRAANFAWCVRQGGQKVGRKIQKTAELAKSGDGEIAVVTESDWVIALK